MPRVIHRLMEDPGVLVLAVDTAGPDEEAAAEGKQHEGNDSATTGAHMNGIICGERRGSTVFLYGLRVREGVRGKGLGHVLMEAICARAPPTLADRPYAAPQPPAPLDMWRSELLPGCEPMQPSDDAKGLAEDAARSTLSHIVTCTVSYNPAAQRIIGRQLMGPLYEVRGAAAQGLTVQGATHV
jgi:hypothetical protein